jgi:hypothetical protein
MSARGKSIKEKLLERCLKKELPSGAGVSGPY